MRRWSTSVDRHLEALLAEGSLQKLAGGLYYYPEKTVFGIVPPKEDVLVRSFLKDNRFLLTTPNLYNSLGVGTIQLYSSRIVYNLKRSGEFTFGNRKFVFRVKPHFPRKITPEFLLVDLADNLHSLAEDPVAVLKKIPAKVATMDLRKLKQALTHYGGAKAKKILTPLTEFKLHNKWLPIIKGSHHSRNFSNELSNFQISCNCHLSNCSKHSNYT